ncbi:hypothetical protein DV737_g3601, partial [Chaetothyriales sp. CBS 132003]
MKSVFLALATGLLARLSFASAAPSSDLYTWSPALASYYSAVAQHIQDARASGAGTPTCDLSNVTLPTAPTPLPSPDGLSLSLVVVGRGVQNYTCANSTAEATPVALGALATLYNASCLAANYPDLLSMIPNIVLNMPNPSLVDSPTTLGLSDIDLSGHHFFATNTTPTFELDSASNPSSHLGIVVGKKAANSTAPASAPQGKYGAVPWLYLSATNASETVGSQGAVRVGADVNGDEWKAVYRLLTAGGSNPKTCKGQNATSEGFSIDYSAVYYFYKGTSS